MQNILESKLSPYTTHTVFRATLLKTLTATQVFRFPLRVLNKRCRNSVQRRALRGRVEAKRRRIRRLRKLRKRSKQKRIFTETRNRRTRELKRLSPRLAPSMN